MWVFMFVTKRFSSFGEKNVDARTPKNLKINYIIRNFKLKSTTLKTIKLKDFFLIKLLTFELEI